MDSLLAPPFAIARDLPAATDGGALQLPFDFARTCAGGALAASHAFTLLVPDVLGAAPDTLLCAVFGVALARYNGQESIPLLYSRLLASGELLSSSALRLRTAAQSTLRELLAQVAVQAETLGPCGWSNGGSRAAISVIDSDVGAAPDVQRLLAQSPAELRSADIHWVITGAGERRHCAIVYNAGLFKASSVARWAAHLEVLLGHVGAHREAPLGAALDTALARLPLLTAPEREWLAAMGTGRSRAMPGELVHE